MRVKPNETVVQAQVVAIRPEPDGRGAEVDLRIISNESSTPGRDFLQPEPGSVLTAFSAEPEQVGVGTHVRAVLSLNAGPFGSRTVIRSAQTTAPKP